MGRELRTRRIRLDASTACQLRCPSCPTASGEVAAELGTGFLRFDSFRRIVDASPWLSVIELSNWGEIFLNPQLVEIVRYAWRKNVRLIAHNGTNLNTVRDEVLEALVRYRFHHLSVSIDGATPETYATYRVRGDFDTVIGNVRKLNEFKRRWRSRYPTLRWQFVVFGHNEHEIERARAMARGLGMDVTVKLNWENLYTESFSPVHDAERVRDASARGVASRSEYEAEAQRPFKSKTCWQLWRDPVVNFDGRILGCCINHWGDMGRVEGGALREALANETLEYARDMVTGRAPARPEIPCSRCDVYEKMQKRRQWVREEKIGYRHDPPRFAIGLLNKVLPRLLGRPLPAD